MPRRIEVPELAVLGCEWCARARTRPFNGGGYDFLCRGCLVRWLADQDDDTRRRYFARVLASLGAETVAELMKEIAELEVPDEAAA